MLGITATPQVDIRRKLITSSYRKNSDSTLVDKFSEPVPSSHESNQSKYEDVLQRVDALNKNLQTCPETGAFLLKSASELWQLLDLYYSRENPIPSSEEMFPYLHGLSSVKQRTYYHKDFDVEKDFDVLSQETEDITQRYPHFSEFGLPTQALHLMTVNSVESSNPTLINSVFMDNLLVLRPDRCDVTVSDELRHSLYEPFDSVYRLQELKNEELRNRNYDLQIRLMAPLCHFLFYNDVQDRNINFDAAKLISSLMGSDQKPIYIVDFSMDNQSLLQPYMCQSLRFPFCDPSNETECASNRNKLALLEQRVIWQLNGIQSVFSNLYVGNALNYHQLMTQPDAYPLNFSLYICCHDKARFPSREKLNSALNSLNSKLHNFITSLEFPDSMGRYGSSITESELLNYMNVLRLIKIAIRQKRNVFVYSYDGFAGSSLLLLSYGVFSRFSCVDDGLVKMFARLQPKVCLAKEDFYFLKTVEGYISWFKCITTRSHDLIFDIALQKSDESAADTKHGDWFKAHTDVNFPSHVYGSLFLGSAQQASSLTILSSLKIKKVISIDEKPAWFSKMSCTFQHEATCETVGPVVKPIFSFNNGKSLVYEVTLGDALRSKIFNVGTEYPKLNSFVYFHNIRDDGKDSFLELLEQCPEEIQQKILVDPRQEERVLFHCRVGVSRSATLVIASLMKYFCIGFLESYLHVRVLRYNMIIQPNLRLFYELFLYEQHLRALQNGVSQRKDCWWTISDQVYRLNKPYIK